MESSSRPNLQMFFFHSGGSPGIVCLFVFAFFFPVQRGGMVNLHIICDICVLLYIYKDVESSLLENLKKRKNVKFFSYHSASNSNMTSGSFGGVFQKRCFTRKIQRKIRNAVGADLTKGIVRFSNLQSGETLVCASSNCGRK